MKLLMFLSPRFSWRPHRRALPGAAAPVEEAVVEDCAVIFVHAEVQDSEQGGRLLTRFVKNVKWIANKRAAKTIVLHSFTHLSDSKAEPAFAEAFLADAAARLEAAGYRVRQTPFGYSCAWDLAVHGDTVAKVFKTL